MFGGPVEWKMSFHYLPEGFNRIIIQGNRTPLPDYGQNGFAIDGIAIDKCDKIGKFQYYTCSHTVHYYNSLTC